MSNKKKQSQESNNDLPSPERPLLCSEDIKDFRKVIVVLEKAFESCINKVHCIQLKSKRKLNF